MKKATIVFKNGFDKWFSNDFTDAQATSLISALTAFKNGEVNATKVYFDSTSQVFLDLDYVVSVSFEESSDAAATVL